MPVHNIQPIFNQNSTILILGSFPSVKSREGQFFYDHPQNRFWKVLAAVFEQSVPLSHAEKKVFLLSNSIALWDVLASCEIRGSSDSTILNPTANDLSLIIEEAPIRAVFCNGTAAYEYYQRFSFSKIGMTAVKLPSTSPANAAFNLQKLIQAWQIIKNDEG